MKPYIKLGASGTFFVKVHNRAIASFHIEEHAKFFIDAIEKGLIKI